MSSWTLESYPSATFSCGVFAIPHPHAVIGAEGVQGMFFRPPKESGKQLRREMAGSSCRRVFLWGRIPQPRGNSELGRAKAGRLPGGGGVGK